MSDSISIPERFRRWWTRLESDWQAVCLGLFAVVTVSLGINIPW